MDDLPVSGLLSSWSHWLPFSVLGGSRQPNGDPRTATIGSGRVLARNIRESVFRQAARVGDLVDRGAIFCPGVAGDLTVCLDRARRRALVESRRRGFWNSDGDPGDYYG